MKAWVLIRKDYRPEHRMNRFLDEAKKLSLDLKFKITEEFEVVEDVGKPQIFYEGKPTQKPSIVLTHITPTDYFGLSLIRSLERYKDICVFNKSKSKEIAKDKLLSTSELSAKKVPIPQTILARFPIDTNYVAERLGFPLVLKTVMGSLGQGVFLIEERSQLEDVLQIIQATRRPDIEFILQRYVKKSHGKDIRVMVIGDQAIGAMKRESSGKDFRSNLSLGGAAEPLELTDEIAQISVQASQALGLEVAGVDLLFDEKGYCVGEVNSSPLFDGFEKTTGINVTKKILEHAIQKAQS